MYFDTFGSVKIELNFFWTLPLDLNYAFISMLNMSTLNMISVTIEN
jgi:hypothetical protein